MAVHLDSMSLGNSFIYGSVWIA